MPFIFTVEDTFLFYQQMHSPIITQPRTFYIINILAIYATAYTKLHGFLYYHVEVNFIMTVKDAVAKRFEQLCDQRGIRPNELATRAGVTPSTVYSMLDPSRQRVSIATIKKLCDGLDITLGQFFSCTLFDELEQEIQ